VADGQTTKKRVPGTNESFTALANVIHKSDSRYEVILYTTVQTNTGHRVSWENRLMLK